jgi:hypothetical protein
MQDQSIIVSLPPFLGERFPGNCPDQLPREALFVGIVYWVYGPGWVVKYSMSSTLCRNGWILWGQDDLGEDWGYGGWRSAVPLASCPKAGSSRELAARSLLRSWWCHLRDHHQGYAGRVIDIKAEPWSEVYKLQRGGNRPVLSVEALQQLKESLWPRNLFASNQTPY